MTHSEKQKHRVDEEVVKELVSVVIKDMQSFKSIVYNIQYHLPTTYLKHVQYMFIFLFYIYLNLNSAWPMGYPMTKLHKKETILPPWRYSSLVFPAWLGFAPSQTSVSSP